MVGGLVAVALLAPGTATAAGTAYVVNQSAGSISQFPLSASDESLGPSAASANGGTSNPYEIALSPDGHSAYVTDHTGTPTTAGVNQYDINPLSGLLSPKSPAAVPAGQNPEAVTVGPAGTPAANSVYVANVGDNTVSLYSADPNTGALTPKSPASVTILGPAGTALGPTDVAVTPDGAHLYVSLDYTGKIVEFNINPDGSFSAGTFIGSVAAGMNPRRLAVSPDGKHLYATDINGGHTNIGNVWQYTINADGTLAAMSPASVPAGEGPTGILVTPTDVYVPNVTSADVSQFAIGAGGGLSPLSPASVTAGAGAFGIAASPTRTSAYVTAFNANAVFEYSIGATGALTPKSSMSMPTGTFPEGIAVGPAPPSPNQTLTVTVTGSGTVTSQPAGVNACAATCMAPFTYGTAVTLTAAPATGSTFSGWGGACAGTSTTCTVTLNADESVSAAFAATGGGGTTTGAGTGVTGEQTPPTIGFARVFCGVRHRGRCDGLQVSAEFGLTGEGVWTFGAYNPTVGHLAAGRRTGTVLHLGTVRRRIERAGKVSFRFKLTGARSRRLYAQVKRHRLAAIRILLTFAPDHGRRSTLTRTVRLTLG